MLLVNLPLGLINPFSWACLSLVRVECFSGKPLVVHLTYMTILAVAMATVNASKFQVCLVSISFYILIFS